MGFRCGAFGLRELGVLCCLGRGLPYQTWALKVYAVGASIITNTSLGL